MDTKELKREQRNRKIVLLREDGYSQRQVARITGVSRRTVRDILVKRRPDLSGVVGNRRLKPVVVTQKDIDNVFILRVGGRSCLDIATVTGVPEWKVKEIIAEEAPGLVDIGAGKNN